MKIEWQPEDIKPGRIVGKPERGERWMIGYLGGAENLNKWVLVSLADGMVTEAGSQKQMATKLNDSGELPIEFFSDYAMRGQKGGNARAIKLTPERRSQIASEAANARWREAQKATP